MVSWKTQAQHWGDGGAMIAGPQEKRALACARETDRGHLDVRDGRSQGGRSCRAIREPPRSLGRVEA